MVFSIEHQTTYQYTEPVFLEPHHLYFLPATRPHLRLRSFELTIKPQPQGCSARLDAENNVYHQCWFSEKVSCLEIQANFQIETMELNPFDFLIETTRESQLKVLETYLQPVGKLSDDLQSWIQNLGDHRHGDLDFLKRLCVEISNEWRHTIRYGEHLMDPNHSFDSKIGSCRDLSWMLIQILRYLGIPARFISGYCHNPELAGHELHAWVEVWLSGAGWIGLDPSAGLLATGDYIPVSCSFQPSNTLPVQGTYRGDADSKLSTTVSITQMPVG